MFIVLDCIFQGCQIFSNSESSLEELDISPLAQSGALEVGDYNQ